MTTMKKIFVQIYASNDTEARYFNWVDVNRTYEDETKRFAESPNAWFGGVRLVEKTFDPETFKVTTRVIKGMHRDWWTGQIIEENG